VSLSFSNFNKSFKRIGYLRFGKYADRWFISKEKGIINVEKLQKEMRQAGWEVSIRGYGQTK